MTILFRCNAGPAVGMGHLTRCRALAQALRTQGETWVLVHVEVQGDAEAGFAERMYVYNYRI